jgi:hypothetical protein
MTRRTTTLGLAAGLWLATIAPSNALAELLTPVARPVDKVDWRDSRWGLDLGVQSDRGKAGGVTGALMVDVFEFTRLHGSGHATVYPGVTPAGHATPPHSIGAEAGVLQRFGRFGLDVAIGHWLVVNTVTANELNASASFAGSAFSGGLSTGLRRSRFATFGTTATADFGGGVQTASVTATCRVNNTQFGADGRWQGRAWGAHAAFSSYQYQDVSCGFVAGGIGAVSVSETAAEFATTGSALLAHLQYAALPTIGQQPTLAKSRGQFGVSWRHRDLGIALDYLRQQDYFLGSTGTAVFGTLTGDLGEGSAVDVTFGGTRGAGMRLGPFGGFGVRTRF